MIDPALLDRIVTTEAFPAEGRILRLGASEIVADGPDLSIGAQCVAFAKGLDPVRAQVVSVADNQVTLVPFHTVDGLRVGDVVRAVAGKEGLPVGDGFAGRAIDALGRPIDGGPPIRATAPAKQTTGILDRLSPDRPLQTGIRAIDGMLSIGHGQRIGIFAASGVGKTRLIEQILRQVDCQRVVICLVGERGREVEVLWRQVAASAQRDRTTIVAATSDERAPMRAQAVEQALALANHWRSLGEDVLFVVDSVTRLAMALREIGLVAGEPPTVRAYTPNVFRELPRLVERCGAIRQGGSITAIFTVLSENDDVDDPIVEVMKSLLDGHIVLSRRMAQAGHFPAIDVGRSISRLFDRLVDPEQARAATRCRALLVCYEEARILIESGMYKPGSDRDLDLAISARNGINGFLQQGEAERAAWPQMRDRLIGLARAGGGDA